MTPEYWRKHLGRNPAPRFGAGRQRWTQKVTDPRTGLEHDVTFLGPKNPNRWLPHQGKRECARRQSQRSN